MSVGNGILIIDDHPLFRKGVAQLIAMAPHLEVVGEASNGERGVEVAKALNPDLILLDLDMAGMGGIETLKAIRAADLDCRVVILTVSDNADELVAAIRSGADGYLLKDMEPEDLLSAIDGALNGRTVIDGRLAGLLARAIREETMAKQRDTATLTDREKEILRGLAQGFANKLIARNLKITEATVKVHVKSLLKKLGFHSRLEAAVWAVGRAQRSRPPERSSEQGVRAIREQHQADDGIEHAGGIGRLGHDQGVDPECLGEPVAEESNGHQH